MRRGRRQFWRKRFHELQKMLAVCTSGIFVDQREKRVMDGYATNERTEDMSLSKSILLSVLSALLISWKRSSVCMSS